MVVYLQKCGQLVTQEGWQFRADMVKKSKIDQNYWASYTFHKCCALYDAKPDYSFIRRKYELIRFKHFNKLLKYVYCLNSEQFE